MAFVLPSKTLRNKFSQLPGAFYRKKEKKFDISTDLEGGHVAALMRAHAIGLQPVLKTVNRKTTEQFPQA